MAQDTRHARVRVRASLRMGAGLGVVLRGGRPARMVNAVATVQFRLRLGCLLPPAISLTGIDKIASESLAVWDELGGVP